MKNTCTAKDVAFAMQKFPKGWKKLYDSKNDLQREWLDAVRHDKRKAITMLEQYNK